MTEEELANPDEPESPEEVIDGLPVLAEVRPLEPAPAALPAVQAAAMAATGFLAGAATLALVRRHSTRKLGQAQRALASRARDEIGPMRGSRTYLVHVRVIPKPGE